MARCGVESGVCTSEIIQNFNKNISLSAIQSLDRQTKPLSIAEPIPSFGTTDLEL